MVNHMYAREGCWIRLCVLRISMSEVRLNNCQFFCLGRKKEELKKVSNYLSLLKWHWFLWPNDLEGMSASSFRIHTMWSVNKSDVQHARCYSASAQRSLPSASDLFQPFFSVCHCWCVVWVHGHISVSEGYLHYFQYNPLNNKAVIYKFEIDSVPSRFSVLSVKILLLVSILVSIQWVT